MQVFCCGRGRRARDGRALSTPVPRSPARPRPYISRIHGPGTDFPMIPLDATRAPSLITTPRHEITMDPSILEVEDSDTEPNNENCRNSGTNTLGALKAKLSQRLSQRPVSAGCMQRSAGSSEEELARRAELRRFRQRRIREELETDAESESQSKEHGCSQDNPRAQTDSNGGVPRDTTEISISTVDNDNGTAFLPGPFHKTGALAVPIFTRTTTSLSRSSSRSASTAPSREPSVNLESAKMPRERQRGSVYQIPTPHLQPVHLPSIRGSASMASWRLSYSASQLAELIGLSEEEINTKLPTQSNIAMPDSTELDPPKLMETELSESQSNEADESKTGSVAASQASHIADPPDVHETLGKSEAARSDKSENDTENLPDSFSNSNPDRYSPLELWLRVSNTLQSIAHSSTRRNSDSVMDSSPASLVADLSSASKAQQLQTQSLTSHHALEATLLKIPGAFLQQEDSGGSSSSPAAEETRARGVDSTGQGCSTKPISQDPSLNCVGESSCVIVTHRTSKGRDAEHPRDLLGRSSCDILGPNKMLDTDRSETSSYKTAPVLTPTPDVKMLAAKTGYRSRFGSTAASDTASLRRIDAELESVAQRFADTRTSRNQGRAASSRFREEFEIPRATKPTKKASILSRLLHRGEKETRSTLITQNQGQDDHQNCLADATHSPSPAATSRNVDFAAHEQAKSVTASERPSVSQSATGAWQRAVRLEADRRQPPGRNSDRNRHTYRHSKHKSQSGGSSGKASGMYPHDREASSVYSPSWRDSRSGMQSPKSRPVTGSENAEDISGISLDASNRVLKEWQRQIQSEELGSHRAPSFTTYIYATRKFNLIPASWAKWPSNTRAERTGAAGTKDSVEPKDFALTGTTPDGRAKWSTDNNVLIPQTNENQSTPPRSSLSSKLGHNIKSGLAKMLLSRDDWAHFEDDKKQPGEDGYLEYPELELLPNHGGYKEIEALEQQIDKIKNPSNLSTRSRSGCLSGASSRAPLSLTLAREVHMTQSTDRDEAPDPARFLITPPSQLHNASVGRPSTSHTESGKSQQYGTPLTHVSYEDCVPTHMLDENDSSKSERTVKRSKSNTENSIPERSGMSDTWKGRARSSSTSVKCV